MSPKIAPVTSNPTISRKLAPRRAYNKKRFAITIKPVYKNAMRTDFHPNAQDFADKYVRKTDKNVTTMKTTTAKWTPT